MLVLPGCDPGANLKSIPHRCHPILVAFVWELNKETIDLPLGCLQGGAINKFSPMQEELELARQPTGPNPLYHRDD